MSEPKTIYDLGYFASIEEARQALAVMTSAERPLRLPEYTLLTQIAEQFSTKAKERSIAVQDVLLAYQRLRENHEHTDVFCGWKDASGATCGGFMDIEVDATGPFYVCRLLKKHRTPK